MLRILLLGGLLVGCPKSTPDPVVQDGPHTRAMSVATTSATPPTAVQAAVEEPGRSPSLEELQIVSRMLSARDGEPDCSEVSAAVPDADAVATYLYVVQTVSMPPTVPMRAAACLLDQHAEAAAPQIKAWMDAPETAGLARLVLSRLDRLPEALAVACVERALKTELAEDARAAAGDSSHPGVQALSATEE